MTRFEKLKTKNVDELAHWLSVHCSCDDAPWIEWFDKKYCQNCTAVNVFVPALGREVEHSYCEVNHSCKFFPGSDGAPDFEEIIKMWLEGEEEDI